MVERERDIERMLVKVANAKNWHCLKWVCPGHNGVPDRILLSPDGRVIFIEVKRPKGSKVSKLQEIWAKELSDRGFNVATVYTEEDVRRLAEEML